jgi:hypothetical protein
MFWLKVKGMNDIKFWRDFIVLLSVKIDEMVQLAFDGFVLPIRPAPAIAHSIHPFTQSTHPESILANGPML